MRNRINVHVPLAETVLGRFPLGLSQEALAELLRAEFNDFGLGLITNQYSFLLALRTLVAKRIAKAYIKLYDSPVVPGTELFLPPAISHFVRNKNLCKDPWYINSNIFLGENEHRVFQSVSDAVEELVWTLPRTSTLRKLQVSLLFFSGA